MSYVAEVCMKARDLILRDGFMTGGDGWHGTHGWCIEGALGRAMGLSTADSALSHKVNLSPAGQAIRAYLGIWAGTALHSWNDGYGSREECVRVLAEVAAQHTDEPVMEEVTVEAKYEPPAIVVLPPMPGEAPSATLTMKFKTLLGV